MREPVCSRSNSAYPFVTSLLRRFLTLCLTASALFSLLGRSTTAREPVLPGSEGARQDLSIAKAAAYWPWVDYRIQDNGYLWTTIHNNGAIGNVFRYQLPDENKTAPSFYHPRYSRMQHGYYAALWVGGVVNGDTLVSTGIETDWKSNTWLPPMEFWPPEWPDGMIETRSNDPSVEYYSPDAKAELEQIAHYIDTIESGWWMPYNDYDARSHRPLGLAVKQTTYSWSYKYIRDVIIVDYEISNVGRDTIHDAFVGLYYVGCNHHRGEQFYPPDDDIAGYIRRWPYEFEELGHETMNIAWLLDADGWSWSFPWDMVRTTSAFAIAPLRIPGGASLYNFNWWYDNIGTNYNWGPRKAGTHDYPLRLFEGGLGVPRSDREKYHLMSKPEIDYSGYEAALDHTHYGWLPPHEYGDNIADGYLPEFVVSYGPTTIPPDGAANFAVVMAIGKEVHYDRSAFRELFDPYQPQPFVGQLDFEDLITNVRWAKRVYDNPGVDTDFDGDSGKYFDRFDSVVGETIKVYYEGDGAPDLMGASPPPPPEVRVIPENGRLTLRWNGRLTETHFDQFSYAHDFEGYRVYLSRSPSFDEPSVLSSYDHHNFSRYQWDHRRERFMLKELPFTLDSLRVLYGDDFDPLEFGYGVPLQIDDDSYYFVSVDYNASDLSDPQEIHKLYPDAVNDTNDVDEQGRMRYYEYEYVIDNLLPTVPYYVSVTAFDFGHPPKSLEPLESSPHKNMVEVMALKQAPDVLEGGKLNVYCYPNPYCLDGDYVDRGFENRDGSFAPSRSGTIYFANLPNQCSISIFTLDGDLVRRLEHNEPESSGTASVHRWNLITRNTMWVVSGLYYWVVESAYGSQIGKLAIIK